MTATKTSTKRGGPQILADWTALEPGVRYSKAQAALLVGVSRATINNYLNGRTPLPPNITIERWNYHTVYIVRKAEKAKGEKVGL